MAATCSPCQKKGIKIKDKNAEKRQKIGIDSGKRRIYSLLVWRSGRRGAEHGFI